MKSLSFGSLAATAAALMLLGADLLWIHAKADHQDSLTFSNTMTWGAEFAAQRDTETHFPAELLAPITLPPPPQNSSKETRAELDLLKSYRALRTPEKMKEILSERTPAGIRLGNYTVAEYTDKKGKFPATARLLDESLKDLTILMFQQKAKFNRVRPSLLAPDIDPAIEIPGHPAYPSGHSTQTHFVAYVLGELMQNRKAEFVAKADAVAKNREIAGLHYPSDSAAGVLLAQQFFAIMMQNTEFQRLLADAKREWR
ncbi:MAG TPA: phosphatase PAP2 family protein [Candidatus Paceibacterota bacterium]|nr:phosphatase PAP2 family protein [Candidatus Paceibacterota bacterium]